MTEHKTEAERCVTTVTRAYNLGVLPAATVAAIGQVNATLYLAEQQRIGNLIAYTVGQRARLETDVQIRTGLGIA